MLLPLDLRSRSGQNKPWASLPRINLAHPLAANLVFYIYDAGGAAVGLVHGGLGVPFVSTNGISNQASKYGGGIKYAGTTAATNIIMPLRASPAGLTSTAPYSVAMGSMNTGAPVASTVAAGDCDASTNVNIYFGPGATTTTFIVGFNNGALGLTTGAGTNSLNTYHTLLATVPNSTTANIYCDGKLDQTDSVGGSKLSNVANTQFVINSGALNGVAFGGGVNGFVYYFCGWKRVLTSNEARALHDDPYCFLIYPEDEMFAELVGAAAAAAVKQQEIMINQAMKRASYF